jgi:hypothetical protein
MADYVAELVVAAPSLTAEQRQVIGHILRSTL